MCSHNAKEGEGFFSPLLPFFPFSRISPISLLPPTIGCRRVCKDAEKCNRVAEGVGQQSGGRSHRATLQGGRAGLQCVFWVKWWILWWWKWSHNENGHDLFPPFWLFVYRWSTTMSRVTILLKKILQTIFVQVFSLFKLLRKKVHTEICRLLLVQNKYICQRTKSAKQGVHNVPSRYLLECFPCFVPFCWSCAFGMSGLTLSIFWWCTIQVHTVQPL